MSKIWVLNGPNLNLLGKRETSLYGKLSLADIEDLVNQHNSSLGHTLEFFQSNSESELVNKVQSAQAQSVDFIIINPAAFTHTSIALRDAFLAVNIPFMEVHISNMFAREPFRQKSFLSDIADGVITGLGPIGYVCALMGAHETLS